MHVEQGAVKLRAFTIALLSLAAASAADGGPRRGTARGTSEEAGFYFSPSGSDSNDCLTIATRCQTIGKLNAGSYTAGDRIFLEGGQTFAGCISLTTFNVTGSSGSDPVGHHVLRHGLFHAPVQPRQYDYAHGRC